MPVCFQLYKNDSKEPSKFQDIDNEICTFFKVPVHKTEYHHSWYNIIGLYLAMGSSLNEIIANELELAIQYYEPRNYTKENRLWHLHMAEIAAFLKKNYSPNSWREVGKH